MPLLTSNERKILKNFFLDALRFFAAKPPKKNSSVEKLQ